MAHKNFGLVPIRNFAVVDKKRKIYRSAQPLYDYEFAWLKKVLNLGVIVNLRSEKNIDEKMAPKHGIKVITLSVKDHNPPTTEQADEFMELIKNTKGPILFHCEHGHGRTSTFCVLSRLAMGWTLEQALKEEKEIYHYEFKHHVQTKFLEKYAIS